MADAMDALDGGDPDSHIVHSFGQQADSMKKSHPRWSVGRETRDARKSVYISEKHVVDAIGRDGPGFRYEPEPGVRHTSRVPPSWKFGTAAARPPPALAQYPDPSSDILATPPVRKATRRYPEVRIGLCPRGAASNAPDLDAFPLGGDSPGPLRYLIDRADKLRHAAPPKYTMGSRTVFYGHIPQTPEKVGPGIYPVPRAVGPQAKSQKQTLPTFSFGKSQRFPAPKMDDQGMKGLWDGMGEKKLAASRSFSAPSFGFGTSTRDGRGKVAPLLTSTDKGPASEMPKPRQQHPSLRPRKETLKYTDVTG